MPFVDNNLQIMSDICHKSFGNNYKTPIQTLFNK